MLAKNIDFTYNTKVNMKYKQISLKVKHEEVELVSYAFIEAGSEGVNIVDGKDINEMLLSKENWDYFDKSILCGDTENAVITGGFDESFDESGLSGIINSYLGREVEISVLLCDSADWENEWRKYYKPIDFGGIVVVPAWQKNEFGKKAVIIDPGMAFGTGNHETTGMCIKLLQKVGLNGKNVIDVGCGSGILGISSLVLGAASCTFIDIDSQAAEAAESNLKLNGISGQCVICGDLVSKIKNPEDIVIANITADILLRLKHDINSVLNSGGYLIISGIIDGRVDEIISAYGKSFDVLQHLCEKEWNAFLMKRKDLI